jgi:hypothetical protein
MAWRRSRSTTATQAILDAADRGLLRQIISRRPGVRLPNELVYSRTGLQPISLTLLHRRLTWFGHVCRMPPGRPAHQALDIDTPRPGTRRCRGRPRHSFSSQIQHDIGDAGLHRYELQAFASDRPGYRELAKGIVRRRHLTL